MRPRGSGSRGARRRSSGSRPIGSRRPGLASWSAPGLAPARALLLALVLGLGGGCAEPDAAVPPALLELEGLAWVPPGVCAIPGAQQPCVTARALLVDRFEVTRAAWRRAGPPSFVPSLPPELRAAWDRDPESLPASWLALDEARAFAASRGMRLPTASEWMRIAAGTRAQVYPWGPVGFSSVANTLELGLGRLTPVGTFERGCTPSGAYDMLGNVAEWVEGVLPPSETDAGDRAWAMGGSYLSHGRRLYFLDAAGVLRYHRHVLDPAHRSLGVGLRCVADAERYLVEHAASWGAGAAVERRLRAVGRRWGAVAAPVLAGLAGRPGAPRGLAVLLEGARP